VFVQAKAGQVHLGTGVPYRHHPTSSRACLFKMSDYTSPSNPRALACLMPRDSKFVFHLRSLNKRSPPPPPLLLIQVPTNWPLCAGSTGQRVGRTSLKSWIKLPSSSSSSARRSPEATCVECHIMPEHVLRNRADPQPKNCDFDNGLAPAALPPSPVSAETSLQMSLAAAYTRVPPLRRTNIMRWLVIIWRDVRYNNGTR